jgi:hypothetical protein
MFHYIVLGSTFIPCPKSYNQTWLGLEFQIKRNLYTKRILITKENIKLSPVTDRDTATNQSATSALFFRVIGRLPSANTGTDHRHEYVTTSGLSHIRLFLIDNHLHWQLSCRLITIAPSADPHSINSRCVSKDMCPKNGVNININFCVLIKSNSKNFIKNIFMLILLNVVHIPKAPFVSLGISPRRIPDGIITLIYTR